MAENLLSIKVLQWHEKLANRLAVCSIIFPIQQLKATHGKCINGIMYPFIKIKRMTLFFIDRVQRQGSLEEMSNANKPSSDCLRFKHFKIIFTSWLKLVAWWDRLTGLHYSEQGEQSRYHIKYQQHNLWDTTRFRTWNSVVQLPLEFQPRIRSHTWSRATLYL